MHTAHTDFPPAVVTLPAPQPTQFAFRVPFENVPAPHTPHTDPPPTTYRPAPHDWSHTDPPTRVLYVPPTHVWQLELAPPAAYWPAPHGAQRDVTFPGEYRPATHASHTLNDAREYPALHAQYRHSTLVCAHCTQTPAPFCAYPFRHTHAPTLLPPVCLVVRPTP